MEQVNVSDAEGVAALGIHVVNTSLSVSLTQISTVGSPFLGVLRYRAKEDMVHPAVMPHAESSDALYINWDDPLVYDVIGKFLSKVFAGSGYATTTASLQVAPWGT